MTVSQQERPRVLSRNETHDLSMIIKDRVKVLEAHANEQAAKCLSQFEKEIAARYQFDADEVWAEAVAEAQKVVAEAQDKIAKRCEKLGIPAMFAPGLELDWRKRGENMVASRRAELRRIAQATVDAMKKAALTKIMKQSLDLRTQVVAMGLLSPDAKMFLESLAPVEDAMKGLDFAAVELTLEKEKRRRIEDGRSYYQRGVNDD